MRHLCALQVSLHLLGVSGVAFGSVLVERQRTSPSYHTQPWKRADKPDWPYGVVGDSWGSGIAYSKESTYDNNLDKCLRTVDSHGPQLEADTSWTGDFSGNLRDAACSGSQLIDIATDAAQHQFAKVGNPDMVVMTSGGNNAGFGHIVDVCIYHSQPTHDYGKPFKDDDADNPTGECGKALKDASAYISDEGRMKNDLVLTLQNAFAEESVKNNQNFLLYLTGYAQFFGTDYDSWCNGERWNIPSPRFTQWPYLSEELRRAFNDRILAVNKLYSDVITSQFSAKGRYIDVDSGFSGHRFCEKGQTHDDQFNTDTKFEKVYLWNLNYFTGKADEVTPQGTDLDSIPDQAVQLLSSKGVTGWSEGGNEVDNGWRLRPFHPRYSGYTTIKEAVIAQMKKDGFPKAKYARGTCSFHLIESQTCLSEDKNLWASITMYDDKKNIIGQSDTKGLGDHIDDGNSLSFKSQLPYALVVTGEHQGDYVQFNYNGLEFKSTDEGSCSQGGWDPRQGPSCGPQTFPAKRQMDCSFPC